MYRSKAKKSRAPEPPASYLEGVPMKLSDSFRRPARVALPFNVVVNDLDRVLQDLHYDFSLEESVVRNAAEQRRIWEEAEKRKKDQEDAAKKAKEEAESAAATAADSSKSSTSSSSNAGSPTNANNSNSAVRPSTIPASRPSVPPRPHPSSLPSPLLREVTAEKILQPKTIEGVRPARPPSTILSTSFSSASFSPKTATVAVAAGSASITASSSSTPAVAASAAVGAGAFNVADWERCEDPFEIMERRTINDMEELKNVLESVSSTQIEAPNDAPTSNADDAAEATGTQLNSDTTITQTAEESATIAHAAIPPNSLPEPTESSNAEAEVLSNVERPPSYDEVIGDAASGGNANSASAEGAVMMGLQKLQLTSVASPAAKKRSEIASPSTPTSEEPKVSNSPSAAAAAATIDPAETTVKRQISTSGAPTTPTTGKETASANSFSAVTPTTPSFPEYVSLPDFPSLSEADLPTNQLEGSQEDSDASATGPVFEEAVSSVQHDDSTASEPPFYQRLSPTLKVLVDKLVDMGFDISVTSRAAERFGADEKQVIDHLCSVSLLSEEGFSGVDVEEALLSNDGKDKQARKYLKALSQLRQFGFEESKIKAALVESESDTEKALDKLMVA